MCKGCGGTCGALDRMKKSVSGRMGGSATRVVQVVVHKNEVIIPRQKYLELKRQGMDRFLPKRKLG
tara:strand:- start:1361 stop:1558 length:198 start_codon:yes stop_codon:yes gene_type:complete